MTRKLKTWTYLGETFIPCAWKDSTDAGARWYAVVQHHGTGLDLDERHSPRFATKEQARDWAKDRKDANDAAEYFYEQASKN